VSAGDWIAVAAIVTGGVVSIAVTGLTYWFQDRAARLGQRRDVLDSAGGAVSDVVVAARRRVVAQGDEVKETGEAFADKFGAVQLYENRIAIRLGNDHRVTAAYDHVVAQLARISKKFWDAHGPLDPNAQRDVNALIDAAKEAQRNYLESARALVHRDR
jgi:hypothetical protein